MLLCGAPALSAEAPTVLRLPASSDPAIFTVQKTMIEAWNLVRQSFVDEKYVPGPMQPPGILDRDLACCK